MTTLTLRYLVLLSQAGQDEGDPENPPSREWGVEMDLPIIQNRTEALQPFTAIEVCLPFNLAIAPGTPGQYSAVAVGEMEALDAIQLLVDNGTLQVYTGSSFNTTNAVELAVGPLFRLLLLLLLLL
jgi:hypothetical protein